MIKDSLMDWMPEYYTGENVAAIQEARDTELESVSDDTDRIYADMFVSIAEDIEYWENEYGITPTTDDLETRRSVVLAFIRGGSGALTYARLEALVKAFVGSSATVSITEYPDRFLTVAYITYPFGVTYDFAVLKETLLSQIQAHATAEIAINIPDASLTGTEYAAGGIKARPRLNLHNAPAVTHDLDGHVYTGAGLRARPHMVII